jgi:2-alkyl-3-oxoalkanoate reductase
LQHRCVAVTGATGFIGTHLLRSLLEHGCTVRALTRARSLPKTPFNDRITWITGDLVDGVGVDQLVAGADTVVHCAGAVRGARAVDFDAINVFGTQRLVDAAARANVDRLLSLSSLAAREPSLSLYASSKRRGEDVLREADVSWTVFRPPAVYGPGDKELAPLFGLMLRGVAVTPGHTGRFSLLYVADLVRAMIVWLDAQHVARRCFELDDGAANGYDWRQLVAIAATVRGGRVLHWPVPRPVLAVPASVNQWIGRVLHRLPMLTPGKVRELYHRDWVCDAAEIRQAMNWCPQVGFADGLRQTFPVSK